MCVCKSNGDYSGQVWRNISCNDKKELGPYLQVYQFPGQGQHPQHVITFSGAIKLIMLLPGERAKQHRTVYAEIIQRYAEGDLPFYEKKIVPSSAVWAEIIKI
jgi:hypothetical protein